MGSKGVGKKKAPESTQREAEYLRDLVERKQSVRLRLNDNLEHTGTIEYFDGWFMRRTRPGQPNLFVFELCAKYMIEG